MANETVVTVVGNLTADPELRILATGHAVASFTIASTPRTLDRGSNEWRDGEALFLRCSLWRQAGENVAESLRKGHRVIAQGRLRQRSYQTSEGDKRTVIELDVEEIGPSLRFTTATLTKATRGQGLAPADHPFTTPHPAAANPAAAPVLAGPWPAPANEPPF